MGHTHSTIVIVNVGTTDKGVKKIGYEHDEELGAYHCDLNLFSHFSKICVSKGGEPVC